MDISKIGKTLASESRVQILAALMGGQALPASELAYRARVTNQTASEHLRLLEKTGLISQKACGRHRYYEIATPEVSDMLEGLSIAFQAPPPNGESKVPDHLKKARFCYDHLAGELGVGITDRLIARNVLAPDGRDYHVLSEQPELLTRIGLNVAEIRKKKRCFSRQCIDWSERRPHLAGALGAALASRFIDLRWIARSRDDRSVRITDNGKQAFNDWIDLSI